MEIKDFDDLIKMGQVRRVVKLGAHEIAMHTLSSDEYSGLSAAIGDDPSKVKFEELQRSVLAVAIDTIDGKVPSKDEKIRLLGLSQLGLANMLYSEYTDMIIEQDKMLDDAKKNSSQVKLS